jgi:hypothetical protein
LKACAAFKKAKLRSDPRQAVARLERQVRKISLSESMRSLQREKIRKLGAIGAYAAKIGLFHADT